MSGPGNTKRTRKILALNAIHGNLADPTFTLSNLARGDGLTVWHKVESGKYSSVR